MQRRYYGGGVLPEIPWHCGLPDAHKPPLEGASSSNNAHPHAAPFCAPLSSQRSAFDASSQRSAFDAPPYKPPFRAGCDELPIRGADYERPVTGADDERPERVADGDCGDSRRGEDDDGYAREQVR